MIDLNACLIYQRRQRPLNTMSRLSLKCQGCLLVEMENHGFDYFARMNYVLSQSFWLSPDRSIVGIIDFMASVKLESGTFSLRGLWQSTRLTGTDGWMGGWVDGQLVLRTVDGKNISVHYEGWGWGKGNEQKLRGLK